MEIETAGVSLYKNLYSTLPFFAHVHKWVLAAYHWSGGWVTQQWNGIPFRGSSNTPSPFMLNKWNWGKLWPGLPFGSYAEFLCAKWEMPQAKESTFELARCQLCKYECQHNSRASGCPVYLCPVRVCYDKILTSNMALEQWHKTRWNGDKEHTNRDLAYSSKCETTVFEIQTRGWSMQPPPL